MFTPAKTLLSTFDVDFIAPEALLFQTGYLTITAVEEQPNDYPRYRLGYPNREVRPAVDAAHDWIHNRVHERY